MWNDFSVVGFPYALWVLLPLIPSILIFLIFPNSTVMAQGPLAGLTVRAGGAFAEMWIGYWLRQQRVRAARIAVAELPFSGAMASGVTA